MDRFGWTSLKDKFPMPGQKCLVYIPSKFTNCNTEQIRIAVFYKNEFRPMHKDPNCPMPSHWMAMPFFPEKKERWERARTIGLEKEDGTVVIAFGHVSSEL
jgi:hypothetical protein